MRLDYKYTLQNQEWEVKRFCDLEGKRYDYKKGQYFVCWFLNNVLVWEHKYKKSMLKELEEFTKAIKHVIKCNNHLNTGQSTYWYDVVKDRIEKALVSEKDFLKKWGF